MLNRITSLSKGHRGFTLIELLVVIAIIGILASIVLVSLSGARNKGADATIQGNLNAIRTQAELYASNNGNSYGTALATTTAATNVTACTANANLFQDPTIKQALTSAQSASGGNIVCASGTNFWAVAVQMKSNTGQYWCVASNGISQALTTAAPLTAGSANTCY